MQLLLPTLRADFKALETYVYQDEKPLDLRRGLATDSQGHG
jgi:surfactin synthase thioesterase subunit